MEPEGLAPTGARVTYFGSAETTGLSTFSSVLYPELWPGIDLQFNALGDSVKYELIVRPGADPHGAAVLPRPAAGNLNLQSGS